MSEQQAAYLEEPLTQHHIGLIKGFLLDIREKSGFGIIELEVKDGRIKFISGKAIEKADSEVQTK